MFFSAFRFFNHTIAEKVVSGHLWRTVQPRRQAGHTPAGGFGVPSAAQPASLVGRDWRLAGVPVCVARSPRSFKLYPHEAGLGPGPSTPKPRGLSLMLAEMRWGPNHSGEAASNPEVTSCRIRGQSPRVFIIRISGSQPEFIRELGPSVAGSGGRSSGGPGAGL